MELGGCAALPCQSGDDVVTPDSSDVASVTADYDLSNLPVTSVDNRLDLLLETVCVGKAVMKGMWLSGQSTTTQ